MNAGLGGVRGRDIANPQVPLRKLPIRTPRKPLLLAHERPDRGTPLSRLVPDPSWQAFAAA
eukprot:11131498-Alexandrium_andersonii.AAC.1